MFSIAEVNAAPSLESRSLVFQQAAAVGMTHAHVLRHLVDGARQACCMANSLPRASRFPVLAAVHETASCWQHLAALVILLGVQA